MNAFWTGWRAPSAAKLSIVSTSRTSRVAGLLHAELASLPAGVQCPPPQADDRLDNDWWRRGSESTTRQVPRPGCRKQCYIPHAWHGAPGTTEPPILARHVARWNPTSSGNRVV